MFGDLPGTRKKWLCQSVKSIMFQANFFKPLFRLTIVRACVGHKFPESCRVVHFPPMHQFMNDQIIADLPRSLDEPPVE